MPRGVPVAPLIDRFMHRVNKNGKIISDELGHCWEWTGGTYSTGYGQLVAHVWGDDYTHRWSYKHHKGDIPVDMVIRHKCDNRVCVNPDHLELGTKGDNVADMLERHSTPCNRKFTAEQVEYIKQLRSEGKLYRQIAEIMSCNRRTIERIFTGQHYQA